MKAKVRDAVALDGDTVADGGLAVFAGDAVAGGATVGDTAAGGRWIESSGCAPAPVAAAHKVSAAPPTNPRIDPSQDSCLPIPQLDAAGASRQHKPDRGLRAPVCRSRGRSLPPSPACQEEPPALLVLPLLFAVAVWAGAQNALAGGGSFVTLPALMFSGLDARAANIASTLALFPGQVTTGWFGRSLVSGAEGLRFRTLVVLSLAGGVVGAGILLVTPSSIFGQMVPWLVLFATALFAWGSFGPKPAAGSRIDPRMAGTVQFLIAVYGGYFGGGIGFLMLAALTAAGLAVRTAGATKNVLASVMNAAAVLVFVFTPHIPWLRVAVVAVGAVIGGWLGALALRHVNEKIIRGFVVVLGVALTVGLFVRAGH